jgi:hypothetical protein
MYGLVAQADKDRGLTYLPWRLHVYAKYGEGPHNAGLTLMPLAWMLAWTVATTRRYLYVFVLAVVMAAITLTNWIAGLALAITLVLMMGASVGVPEFRPLRLFGAGALAYGWHVSGSRRPSYAQSRSIGRPTPSTTSCRWRSIQRWSGMSCS